MKWNAGYDRNPARVQSVWHTLTAGSSRRKRNQRRKKKCYDRTVVVAATKWEMFGAKNISHFAPLRMIVFISYRFIYTWIRYQKCCKTSTSHNTWTLLARSLRCEIARNAQNMENEDYVPRANEKWKCMGIAHEMWGKLKWFSINHAAILKCGDADKKANAMNCG